MTAAEVPPLSLDELIQLRIGIAADFNVTGLRMLCQRYRNVPFERICTVDNLDDPRPRRLSTSSHEFEPGEVTVTTATAMTREAVKLWIAKKCEIDASQGLLWRPDYDVDVWDLTGRDDGRKQASLSFWHAHPLNPRDPRRLPDGSRWVDAAALSVYARRVAAGHF